MLKFHLRSITLVFSLSTNTSHAKNLILGVHWHFHSKENDRGACRVEKASLYSFCQEYLSFPQRKAQWSCAAGSYGMADISSCISASSSKACWQRGRLKIEAKSGACMISLTDVELLEACWNRFGNLWFRTTGHQRSSQKRTVEPFPREHLAIPLYKTFSLRTFFHQKDPTSDNMYSK